MNSYVYPRVGAALLSAAVVWLFGPGAALAQIVNNSFEQDGQFSLAGWQTTDAVCLEANNEAPAGGGVWSLKLHQRNLQGGCFGVVYQVISQVQDGQVWRVRAWARLPEGRTSEARLYWTKFAPADTSGILPYIPASYGTVVTTTSSQWTALTLVDTLEVDAGDSLGLVLDAGVTSGPTATIDFASFDLVTVDQPSQSDVVAGGETPATPAFTRAHNFPNPFRTATTISFTLTRPEFVTLAIYDLLGREVRTLVSEALPGGTHTAVWEADTLPDGLYVGRLQAGSHSRTIKLVRLR